MHQVQKGVKKLKKEYRHSLRPLVQEKISWGKCGSSCTTNFLGCFWDLLNMHQEEKGILKAVKSGCVLLM
jgi:hypothetical protein